VGADTGTPVDDADYEVPFHFTGKLGKLTIELKPAPLSDADKKLLMIDSQRNNSSSQ
jgi:hypothetical protein